MQVESYAAYYGEMGGEGAAPEPPARKLKEDGDVIQLQKRPKPQLPPAAARYLISPTAIKSLSALLIFAGMVALIVLYRLLTQ
jgi:hypothetical protein